jgi:hypothetical protein
MPGNPFTPGYGTQPPVLAGRDDILDRAIDAYRNGPGDPSYQMLIYGLRGVGKTVLADAIAARARQELGWTVVSISGLNDVAAASDLARQAVDAATSRRRRTRRHDTEPTVGVHLGVVTGEIAAKTRDQLPPTVEPALITLGEHVAATKRGAVIVLDEVQAIPARPDLRAIVAALQTTRRRNLPVAALLTGLPSAPGHLIEAGTFTERMAKVSLGYLSRDATRLALLQPIAEHGAAITADALDAATDASRGYAYFVQLYGFHSWRLAGGGPIDLRHVTAAGVAVAHDAAEAIYQPRIGRLSTLEAAYVRAVADHGERYVPTAAVAATLRRTQSQLSRTREALIVEHNILISERGGTVSFAVPGFARWLADNTPLVVPALRAARPNSPSPEMDTGGGGPKGTAIPGKATLESPTNKAGPPSEPASAQRPPDDHTAGQFQLRRRPDPRDMGVGDNIGL